MTKRRLSKQIFIGKVQVGGGAPISIQSMTKTPTQNIEATLNEIRRLHLSGCEIIRLAVPDTEAANALKKICSFSPIPVIADIHFDYKLALLAIKNGVHALRINPGNIKSENNVAEIARAAKLAEVPIRVGVNAGSLDSDVMARFGGITSEALAFSALEEVKKLEKYGIELIKIAVKAYDVPTMIDAVKIVAQETAYPLHLGVTESGLPEHGSIRSAIGIGALLLQGIGDTIRVSLTGDSASEISVAKHILSSTNLRSFGPLIVSCPTCGRCKIPLQKIASQVKERTSNIDKPIKIAVMGCVVNGPGEAKEADFGIAGGDGKGIVFSRGNVLKTVSEEYLVDELIKTITEHTNN